jgi:glycosyltransferase involved in cell wall biosynthesis
MRILHIIPSLRKGGAERICMDICDELSRQNGVEVKLVYLNNLVEYETANAGYNIKFIPASISLSLTKPAKYNIAGLEKLIKEFKPDIIHSHLFEAEIVSRSITYLQAKWFSHCHDNMHQLETFSIATLTDKKRLTEYYERRYILKRYRANGGNRFVAISKDAYQYFERVLPTDLRNVTLLSNAVNTARFAKPASYVRNTDANKLHLVTVGSLVDKKNQSFLIDVLNELVKCKQPVHLHVLGDGPNRKRLVEKTMHLNLQQKITFHGNVQHVQDYLWNSDIYIHGAYYEPFGLVLVEAMAAGLPVVSLDGKGNRDIIRNGENGYILPTQDAAAFANTIIELANNKILYQQIVAEGFKTAQQFDIVSYTQKLLALYQQAL